MASVLISSILKATTDWLSLIRSTPSTSSTTTTVADDLEKLERMLERIKAVLVDAEEREIVDQSVKLWLKELKDVAYDAEDALDEYQYHVLRTQVENRAIAVATTAENSRKRKHVDGDKEVILHLPFSASNSAASKISILSSMADRIKNIRKRFKEISNARHDLHLKPEDGKRRSDGSSEYPQPTSHMVNEQEVYGREDDRKKLIDWLFSDMESIFEVLAVVGKGGLGKTTIAQLVYNDQKVKDYFETRMWVYVFDDFNLIRLTKAMIEIITEKSCTLSELSVLQRSLQEELNGKKVLLVLDDVWNEKKETWECLSIPFHAAEMFRIIMTTRNDSAAEAMQTTAPYRLGYLPKEQCWHLFERRAFSGRAVEQFPNLVEIGRKIVNRCDGLPLSVKSLGGLLHNETDEDRWKDVLQSNLWELSEETNILPALKLSYNRMPSHLKPCFLICSMFPKKHLFRKDELVELWAAQGYIQNKLGKRVEEVGYKVFNELHRRSFFDEYQGLSPRFKMHDNIHDLAQYISGNKIHHLFINNQFDDLPLDTRALRTVILHRSTTRIKDAILLTKIPECITSLKHLRYLELHFGCLKIREQVFSMLEAIENLTCLRHLELETDGMLCLPESIDRLYNLNILKICCRQIDRLPTLGQLPSLKYFDLFINGFRDVEQWEVLVGEFFEEEPVINNCPNLASILALLNLKTLTSFNSSPLRLSLRFGKEIQLESLRGRFEVRIDDIFEILKNLLNITNLRIEMPGRFHYELRFQRNVRSDLGLWSLHSDVSLVVVDEADKKLAADNEMNNQIVKTTFPLLENLKPHTGLDWLYLKGYDGMRWPSWIGHPSFNKLAQVHICHSCNGQLPTLGHLPSLRCLRLDSISSLKIIGYEFSHDMNLNEVAFPSLISLEFENIPDWEEWFGVLKGDFPQLQVVTMHGCPALSSLSPLRNLNSLEYLCLTGCHALALSGLNSSLMLCRKSRHSPFNKLGTVCIGFCSSDQLPTLGQLPSLRVLTLTAITRLKIVGGEFCRGINCCNEVAFPSLTKLEFDDMPDWEEWYGLQDGGDFPQLVSLSVQKCPKLWFFPPVSSLPPNLRVHIKDCPRLLM